MLVEPSQCESQSHPEYNELERLHKQLIIRRLTKCLVKMCTMQWSQLDFLL